MGWRREEVWLEVDVAWFGERAVAPALAGILLPPLPRFPEPGLTASRLRREAWKRRRRARATALLVLPAVLVPAGLARGGGVSSARVAAQDPPSLTFRAARPTLAPKPKPQPVKRVAARPERTPRIDYRNAISVGLPWSGSLIAGTQLPLEGPDWVTWNPVTDSVPNAPSRLYGNERTIRAIVSVLAEYRAANPRAPKVLVGDISWPNGGRMEAHVSHQNGLDVDVYYPRSDRSLREPRLPSAIDRRLSQDLLDRFLAAGAHMIFVGYATGLDGPSKVVIPYPNHENHMHVRFLPPGA
jgi:Penicillin-insensitive murein endopeptidase